MLRAFVKLKPRENFAAKNVRYMNIYMNKYVLDIVKKSICEEFPFYTLLCRNKTHKTHLHTCNHLCSFPEVVSSMT